jgi:hypothetical protein
VLLVSRSIYPLTQLTTTTLSVTPPAYSQTSMDFALTSSRLAAGLRELTLQSLNEILFVVAHIFAGAPL